MGSEPPNSATMTLEESGRDLRLLAEGPWTIACINEVDQQLRSIADRKPAHLSIDLSGITRLDTAGAFVLERTIRECGLSDARLKWQGVNPDQATLFQAISGLEAICDVEPAKPSSVLEGLDRIGRSVSTAMLQARAVLGLCGMVMVALGRIIKDPKRLRVTSLVYHMEQAGIDAVPIISLLTFLIGAVVAFLGASILRTFGAEVFTIELIAYSILRELGVLLTAIIVAGRSGSAFTAQIGSMKMNEEIDAMRVQGLDPIEVLVVPRVLAFLFMLPLLAFVADVMGLFGGMLVSMATLDISPSMFFVRINEFVPINNFWSGLIKAPFFAFVIALIACHEGLSVKGSAESVGQRTTSSVVQSIFMVIVLDALFAIFYIEVDF